MRVHGFQMVMKDINIRNFSAPKSPEGDFLFSLEKCPETNYLED
jgi:hypothetical protein